jgi:hypothetical protein
MRHPWRWFVRLLRAWLEADYASLLGELEQCRSTMLSMQSAHTSDTARYLAENRSDFLALDREYAQKTETLAIQTKLELDRTKAKLALAELEAATLHEILERNRRWVEADTATHAVSIAAAGMSRPE